MMGTRHYLSTVQINPNQVGQLVRLLQLNSTQMTAKIRKAIHRNPLM